MFFSDSFRIVFNICTHIHILWEFLFAGISKKWSAKECYSNAFSEPLRISSALYRDCVSNPSHNKNLWSRNRGLRIRLLANTGVRGGSRGGSFTGDSSGLDRTGRDRTKLDTTLAFSLTFLHFLWSATEYIPRLARGLYSVVDQQKFL